MGELIVFTKVPEKGYVKTRLNKKFPLYMVEEIYTAFLIDLLNKLEEFDPYIAYYPQKKLQMLWNVIGDRNYIVQKGQDMWERKTTVFSGFYKMGYDYVAAMSCDVPLVQKKHVQQAFSLMAENDLVIGPALDGGIYFIGGAHVRPELFLDVVWKSPDTLDKIRENAIGMGLSVAELEPLQDVDTPDDLKKVWTDGSLDKESKTYQAIKKAYKDTLLGSE